MNALILQTSAIPQPMKLQPKSKSTAVIATTSGCPRMKAMMMGRIHTRHAAKTAPYDGATGLLPMREQVGSCGDMGLLFALGHVLTTTGRDGVFLAGMVAFGLLPFLSPKRAYVQESSGDLGGNIIPSSPFCPRWLRHSSHISTSFQQAKVTPKTTINNTATISICIFSIPLLSSYRSKVA